MAINSVVNESNETCHHDSYSLPSDPYKARHSQLVRRIAAALAAQNPAELTREAHELHHYLSGC